MTAGVCGTGDRCYRAQARDEQGRVVGSRPLLNVPCGSQTRLSLLDRWQVSVADRCWLSRLATNLWVLLVAFGGEGVCWPCCVCLPHAVELCLRWQCSLPWHSCRWLLSKQTCFCKQTTLGQHSDMHCHHKQLATRPESPTVVHKSAL